MGLFTKNLALSGVAFGLAVSSLSSSSYAGVFSLPHFVTSDEFSVGLEPELTLSNNAGLGANFKYTQGLNDLLNATAIIGTGGGDRGFRVGGSTNFDFFPDAASQPGIGLAVQGIYYKLPTTGQFDLTAIPYVHKTFETTTTQIEPFFSFPVGMGFADGRYKALSTAVIGAMFKANQHVTYVTELGVAVNNTESYFSGGFTFYH